MRRFSYTTKPDGRKGPFTSLPRFSRGANRDAPVFRQRARSETAKKERGSKNPSEVLRPERKFPAGLSRNVPGPPMPYQAVGPRCLPWNASGKAAARPASIYGVADGPQGPRREPPMKMAMFDTHAYDRTAFEAANAAFGHAITFFDLRLTEDTAPLARGHDCVCCFVADRLNADALEALHRDGVRLVALRCAGYNNVDLVTAARLGLPVVRVPEYSPHAVAEHAVGLVLALNRKIHRAYARVREWNFSLDGLVGFDLYGKTVGIVGTGRIGLATARIFRGFG